MSLRRESTQKRPVGASDRVRKYDDVQQGLKVVYPAENDNQKSSIDIVFVPGLATPPFESWKATKGDWSWMESPDGIRANFPKARILLFMYESAWQGRLKIPFQSMENISMTLLCALKAKREKCKQRPIVFIGHSMGGLVIAKAITMMNAQQENFPVMLEATSAAVFFGTPFKGAPAAAWGSMFAYYAEKFNMAHQSQLLDMLKPGNSALQELRDEFRRVAAKTEYRIELLCFWEEQTTDLAEMARLPDPFGLAKRYTPKDIAEFVSRDSAIFEGDVPNQGLASNHRNLVKFDSAKDLRWNMVEGRLKRIIHGAKKTAKNRLGSARGIDWPTFKSVRGALDGTRLQPDSIRKGLTKRLKESALISQEPDYVEWLANVEKTETDESEAAKVDGLWVRAPEGRGKTGAMLAALSDVENLVEKQEDGEPVLFAYFLCVAGTDYCSAEDCLKSIIWQLIDQQKVLATHAKDFVKEKVKNGGAPKSRATPSVENLWKALQGILTDEFTGNRVYIVLSNLHLLPEDSDSTLKLLNLLSLELDDGQIMVPGRIMVKWLITSRPTYAIQKALSLERLRVINLEDQRFGSQFAKSLQIHARSKVGQLKDTKKYNNALAWFAHSLIGERAQNISWIDIACLQLEELPEAESDVRVRRVLEETPNELSALLKNAWLRIFRLSGEQRENIEEMLRALILTIEEPTLAELAVLCYGSEYHDQEIRELIEMCRPLVLMKDKVGFMNSAVKQHLVDSCEELLGLSAQETARQHGLLSLRSLAYLKDKFGFPETEHPLPSEDLDAEDQGSEADIASNTDSDDDNDSDDGTESEADSQGYDNEDTSTEDNEDSEEYESDSDSDPEAQHLKEKGALPYMVRNWLHHGSRATIGFADDLGLDDEFWKVGSLVRRRWMAEYDRHTTDFKYNDTRSMNALHVVAAIGFRRLLTVLIENGHQDELDVPDKWSFTPLCLACMFGHADMVEELLHRKAEINANEKEMADTPLHLAAENGHIGVMKKLILQGASLNAFSEYSGLVLNSAISSGNLATIELLVHHGVKLSIDRDGIETPLAQAASLSDVSMLEYLMKEYADQLAPEEYSRALVAAAKVGSLEVLNKLLLFEHGDDDYQAALDMAAKKGYWEITKILLEKRRNLNCDEVFYKAVTRTKDLEVLEALWEYTSGNISAEKIDQSLYKVTDNKKIDRVRLLLDRFGADANAQGDRYGNALTASAYDGTLDILKLLLDHGADVNSDKGWALQAAATEGHIKIVNELLSRGAKVDARTGNPGFPQQTALQGACEYGHTEIVDILLEHGADPNLGGGEDCYPIIAAADNCEIEIIGKLISANANVNVVRGKDGDTALIITAKGIASLKPLEQLLEACAEIDATNNNGDTALIAAAASTDDEFVNFLLAKGADIMHTNNDGLNALQIASKEKNPEDTLSVLIKHTSTILSGIRKEMGDGHHRIISVVNEARAVAQQDNMRDHNSRVKSSREQKEPEADLKLSDTKEDGSKPEDEFPMSISAKTTVPLIPTDQTIFKDNFRPVDNIRNKIEISDIPQQDQEKLGLYTMPRTKTFICTLPLA